MKITKLYRFRAVLSSREDRYIYLEKPILINNIELSPINTQKNKIKVSLTIKANDKDEAITKAKEFLENLCSAILLDTNIAVDVESVDIIEVQEFRKIPSNNIKIEISAFVNIKLEVSMGLVLSEPRIRDTIKIAEKIGGLDERIKRFLKWYRRALLERDPIDRFTQFWVAFEIWSSYKGYKKGKTSERSKMINALMMECKFSEKDANETYELRCGLFHSGVYDEVPNKLSLLEKCLSNIVSKIKTTLNKT